ncbi:very-long-chain 3-oxoacyl-CoA reductase-like protein [Tanacetum coccineum]
MNPQLVQGLPDEPNGIEDKSVAMDSNINLESRSSVTISSRSSVLQACTTNSGFIALAGVVLTSLELLDYAFVAFLPGISEELLFRGVLLPLIGINLTSATAVAALFGILHLGSGRKFSFAIWATFVGLAYGYATILTSSLIVPMASHAINNLIGGVIWHINHQKRENLKNYGSWALITGVTDGIGKAFAFQLAQKGLDLILVSRNLAKLKQVSNEITLVHPTTKIKVFDVDFMSDDVPARVKAMQVVIRDEKLDVGVLVNNVGVTYPVARFFHEVDEEIWMKVVKVNVEGTSLVTKAVIQGMIERKKGAIVNIGSGAAIVVPSHPLYAIYAASKA